MLQGVHRRGRHQIINDHRESRKECMQRNLGILEFAVEAKLKRDRKFEGCEENKKVEVISQRLTPKELMPSPLSWSH
jgi:hypothetical protein